MEKEMSKHPYRDVQTLLFCKIAPHIPDDRLNDARTHDELYQRLYKVGRIGCSQSRSARAFLTFGSFDAICLYPTNPDPSNYAWFRQVYYDKLQLLHMPTDKIVYHQVHLLSQHEDTKEFWNAHDHDYPFFLTTLIYGANISEQDLGQTNRNTDSPASPLEPGECSIYEHWIRLRLREKLREEQVDVKYAIYNGITVSDVVILWRAKDLVDVLNLISYVEFSGLSRKTLTTLGFPLNAKGQVKSCVTDALINNLDKTVSVRVHGLIRNAEQFQSMRKILTDAQPKRLSDRVCHQLLRLTEWAYTDQDIRARLSTVIDREPKERDIGDEAEQAATAEAFLQRMQDRINRALPALCTAMPNAIWSQNLGKDDFTVSAQISYASLASLLEIYRTHYKKLYRGCWEILTDVGISFPQEYQEWFQMPDDPVDILGRLHDSFQKLYIDDANSTESLDLTQFAWFDALQALLGSHLYIDRHPVLHGPAYLVHNSLKIVYAYLAGKVTDYETTEKLLRLLKRSEEQIVHFVRSLDQLTEQISRNNDATLNNRSNTHTVHFSLPESALEFYHAFLRRIVDYLMMYDKKDNRIPRDFEYDFLLSPKTCGLFRFRSIFQTDHDDHDCNTDKIWPQKQAYILELPLESIFNPMEIFIPIVHECFHCFGDTLRQREHRKQYMALFIASDLVTSANLGLFSHQQLSDGIARTIYSYGDNHGTYLSKSIQQLSSNTYRLFSTAHPDILIGNIPEDMRCLWNDAKHTLWNIEDFAKQPEKRITVVDTALKNCKVLFKECYADAMSVALLKLTPAEYLDRFKNQLRSFHNQYTSNSDPGSFEQNSLDRASLAERNAVVLAACHLQNSRIGNFSFHECTEAIRKFAAVQIDTELQEEFNKYAQVLLLIFEALVDYRKRLPNGSIPDSPAALRHVVEYLTSSIELLYTNPPVLSICQDPDRPYTIMNLAEDFDGIIRKGNMFNDRFYSLIFEHYEMIQKQAVQW